MKTKTPLISALSNQQGQSIVQVIVAAAIMSIVMLATISTLVMQNNESKAVEQKLGKTDLSLLIKNTMADGSVCNFELSNASLYTVPSQAAVQIDSSKVGGPDSPVVEFSSLIATASAKAPAIATVGTAASAISKSLVIKNIRFTDFQSAGLPNSYLANLEVDFDPTLLVRPLKPISMPISLKTTGTGALQTVVGCSSDQQNYANCHVVSNEGPAPSYISSAHCPADEHILTGGGVCANHLDFGLGSAGDLGFVHVNATADGINWIVDCWDPVKNIDAPSRAYITCCPN